jgi:prepilin-type processing-associated H-X9-DG protein
MESEIDAMPKRRVPWVAIVVVGVLLFLAISILGPVFASARVAATRTKVVSNLKTLATGWWVYSTDYDDRGCPAGGWNTLLISHPKSGVLEEHLIDPMVECLPTYDCTDNRALGLNKSVGGLDVTTTGDAERVVMFAQSKVGGPNLLVSAETAREGFMGMAFVDGHVKMRGNWSEVPLLWQPPVEPAR